MEENKKRVRFHNYITVKNLSTGENYNISKDVFFGEDREKIRCSIFGHTLEISGNDRVGFSLAHRSKKGSDYVDAPSSKVLREYLQSIGFSENSFLFLKSIL